MFEHIKKPLATKSIYARRVAIYAIVALMLLSFSLTIGTLGYCFYGNLSVVDGFLNASMILTGMGPVNSLEGNSAKVFAGIYAIYSGVSFLTIIGILISPIVHRFLHKMHLERNDNN